MKIGYARVSTKSQDTELQIEALKAAGCEKIYEEQVSGSVTKRPELDNCLKSLRSGDELIVWKLDRLGRSLQHLLSVINSLEDKDIGFNSLTESIDTKTTGGKLIFHIFGSLAEFERGLICERVNAGLAIAKKNGRIGGRKPALSDKERDMARKMYEGGACKADIARHYSVSRQTIYKVLNEN